MMLKNKDFLLNLFIVLIDIITILVLGFILIIGIINLPSIVGIYALLVALPMIYLKVRHLKYNLYILICENYKAH